MKTTKQNRTSIRSIGVGKINRLVRAAAHLNELQPAFAEWAEGEIYICRKTGSYRYRFGDRSKSVTSWSAVATELFTTPEEFAFAAMVFAKPKAQERAAPAAAPATPARAAARVNVISIAREVAA